MMDARNYAVHERLKNGLQVTIRAIRPDDRDALQAAFKELDKRTISLRFFGPKKELTDRELTAATVVDFIQTVALVTCVQDGADEKIIGAGRYVAIGSADPPDRAEVAFTVEEDYQGLGISSLTLRHLAGIARQMGIAQFHAEVLPENTGMLTVFNRSGFPVQQEISEGIAHITLSLSGDKQ
jgi:RimJ/RimL family protein N-acetyltransferase